MGRSGCRRNRARSTFRTQHVVVVLEHRLHRAGSDRREGGGAADRRRAARGHLHAGRGTGDDLRDRPPDRRSPRPRLRRAQRQDGARRQRHRPDAGVDGGRDRLEPGRPRSLLPRAPAGPPPAPRPPRADGDDVPIGGRAPRGYTYGAGIATVPMPSGMAWGHNGSTPGYLSSVLSSRGAKRQVVVLINGGETAFDRRTADPGRWRSLRPSRARPRAAAARLTRRTAPRAQGRPPAARTPPSDGPSPGTKTRLRAGLSRVPPQGIEP
jgi:hypothetical protein